MILPGMPSGRPCALAKTPALTRKHCTFLPPRGKSACPIMCPILRSFRRSRSQRGSEFNSVYSTLFAAAHGAPPPPRSSAFFRRSIGYLTSRDPTSFASHNVESASAPVPGAPSGSLRRSYRSLPIPLLRHPNLPHRLNSRFSRFPGPIEKRTRQLYLVPLEKCRQRCFYI